MQTIAFYNLKGGVGKTTMAAAAVRPTILARVRSLVRDMVVGNVDEPLMDVAAELDSNWATELRNRLNEFEYP